MRCVIELGDRRNPASVAYTIYATILDDAVYHAVSTHVCERGIDLDGVAGYLTWLDSAHTTFMARCSDLGLGQVGAPGYQPMNYLVVAKIIDSASSPQRARALAFRHDADPKLNTP